MSNVMENKHQQLLDYSMVLVITIENEIYTLRYVIAGEDNTGWWYYEEDIPYFCGATAPVAAQYLKDERG